MRNETERYLTRRQLAEFLTERGLPITVSTLDKYAMRHEGPEPEGYWGRCMLYDPNKALAWAKKRFRTHFREPEVAARRRAGRGRPQAA
jgi:hypothetical protein